MLTSIMTQLTALVTTFATTVAGVVTMPPVAISAAFLLLGITIGFIRRFTGAKKGKSRKRG